MTRLLLLTFSNFITFTVLFHQLLICNKHLYVHQKLNKFILNAFFVVPILINVFVKVREKALNF